MKSYFFVVPLGRQKVVDRRIVCAAISGGGGLLRWGLVRQARLIEGPGRWRARCARSPLSTPFRSSSRYETLKPCDRVCTRDQPQRGVLVATWPYGTHHHLENSWGAMNSRSCSDEEEEGSIELLAAGGEVACAPWYEEPG